MTSIYDQGLPKTPANFVALSPTSFVERSAEVFGDLPAVIHGHRRYSWRELRDRSARLAAALLGYQAAQCSPCFTETGPHLGARGTGGRRRPPGTYDRQTL